MATEQKHRADPLDEWADREYPIAEDMTFQRISWTAERAGWAGVVLLMLLALAGLFSVGPLSSTAASDESGALSVRYQHFQRSGAGSIMAVTIAPLDGSGVRLRFDAEFLSAFTIERVQPEPLEWRGEADGAALVFPVPDGDSFTVQFSLLPERAGRVASRLRLGEQASLDLSVFIYP